MSETPKNEDLGKNDASDDTANNDGIEAGSSEDSSRETNEDATEGNANEDTSNSDDAKANTQADSSDNPPTDPSRDPDGDTTGGTAREDTANVTDGSSITSPGDTSDRGKKASSKDKKPRGNGSGPVAWLALFASLVTLAGVGYMLVEDWQTQRATEAGNESIERLTDRIRTSDQSLSDLDRSLSELTNRDVGIESELGTLRRDLDERIDLLDSLPPRLSNVERSMADLQGISAGTRDTWLLAEAEYYLQIANAQLQLAGNPRLAMLALGMADDRILQTANPALTAVRRTIADEIAALEIMDKPDLEGVTLTLSSLARVVESLPLRSTSSEPEPDPVDPGAEPGGLSRAWTSVKDAVKSSFEYTPPGGDQSAFLAPGAENLVRSNLALQLQAARLALLRGEQAIFEQSLDDASALLDTYFDIDSAPVQSAQQTLAEIRSTMFAVTPPDISESLRLLRQHKTLSEPGQ